MATATVVAGACHPRLMPRPRSLPVSSCCSRASPPAGRAAFGQRHSDRGPARPLRRPPAAGRASAGEGAALAGLRRIGTFDPPGVRDARRPATGGGCSWSSRAGGSGSCADGRTLRDAVPRHPRRRSTCGGEQGLLSMAFAPDYATTRALLRRLHRPRRRHARRRVPARRAPTARTPVERAAVLLHGPSPSPTTTAACCCSAPTGCSTSAPATAAAATTSTARAATPRTSARCSARSCASTRARRGGAALPRPVAATRSSAAPGARRRSGPTACATRGASRSTAATGDLVDRRRRPGRDRGDRLRAPRPGARRELRLAAVRGAAAATLRASPRPAPSSPVLEHTHADGNCSITGGYVVRDPRAAGARGRYVYGDFCRGRI